MFPECKHGGCHQWATFGVEGTKKEERCAQHALEGMVDVKRKRRGDPPCKKQPCTLGRHQED